MKVHILRPESITPIARYLERGRAHPDSYTVQKELAAVLLHREREYRGMHQPWSSGGPLPVPREGSAFAPYDLTLQGSAALLSQLPPFEQPSPFIVDLFGLKPLVTDALRPTLRRTKAHAFGWLLLARLLDDLDGLDEAKGAVAVAKTLGEATNPRAMSRFTDRVDDLALRVRAREEGEAFTRYWLSEADFCAAEQARALGGFDERRVPPALRPLIDIARRYGVGDDFCRRIALRRMSKKERARLKERVHAASPAVDEWLARESGPPYGIESSAFFWLQVAADEV